MKYSQKEMGNRVMESRKKKGYKQESLAKQLNISTSYIGKIETGKNTPSIDLLVEMASLLDVSLDYLVLGKKTETDKIGQTLQDAIDMLTELKTSI